MGAQQSAPAPRPIIRPPPPPPPVDPVVQCRINSIDLNQLERDVAEKRRQVESCNPAEAQRRKIQEEQESLSKFRDQMTSAFWPTYHDISAKLYFYDKISKSSEPITKYSSTVAKELAEASKQMTKLGHEERMQRRNFMDSDPQSGVFGFTGLHTSDDKLLLAFWITYGICILAFYGVVLHYFGESLGNKSKKIQIGAILLGVAYGLAYYIITIYG